MWPIKTDDGSDEIFSGHTTVVRSNVSSNLSEYLIFQNIVIRHGTRLSPKKLNYPC